MTYTNWPILSDKFTREICYAVTNSLQQQSVNIHENEADVASVWSKCWHVSTACCMASGRFSAPQ